MNQTCKSVVHMYHQYQTRTFNISTISSVLTLKLFLSFIHVLQIFGDNRNSSLLLVSQILLWKKSNFWRSPTLAKVWKQVIRDIILLSPYLLAPTMFQKVCAAADASAALLIDRSKRGDFLMATTVCWYTTVSHGSLHSRCSWLVKITHKK